MSQRELKLSFREIRHLTECSGMVLAGMTILCSTFLHQCQSFSCRCGIFAMGPKAIRAARDVSAVSPVPGLANELQVSEGSVQDCLSGMFTGILAQQ